MFIVTPETVLNPSALEARQLPRRFLGRVTLIPWRGASAGTVGRMIFEMELLRYFGALLPFGVAALIWQDKALAIAQAPLLMFLAVYAVEMRFLRVPPARREGLIDTAAQESGLDLFRVRAVSILTRIAARRGLAQGELRLVVEQSDLARIAPLSLVSIQSDDGPQVLRLDPEETALIRETLFAPPLTERDLHLISLARDEGLHEAVLDLRTVSAHARLAAIMG